MRKLPTGEPCAGEPPARFGGRGGREPFPTPIKRHNPAYLLMLRSVRKRRASLAFDLLYAALFEASSRGHKSGLRPIGTHHSGCRPQNDVMVAGLASLNTWREAPAVPRIMWCN